MKGGEHRGSEKKRLWPRALTTVLIEKTYLIYCRNYDSITPLFKLQVGLDEAVFFLPLLASMTFAGRRRDFCYSLSSLRHLLNGIVLVPAHKRASLVGFRIAEK